MLLPALTEWFSTQRRMPLGLCPGSSSHQWLWEQGLGAHSWDQLRDLCWALPCLGHFVLDSFPCITANPGCCDHQPICFPRPWHLVVCSSCAAKGMHQHCFTLRNTAATSECDDCSGLGTGKRKPGSPWIPLAKASLLREDWGTTAVSSAAGVCGHATDLPVCLHSFQHVVGSGQFQHHQPGSIIPQLPGSWEERLVRPGWDRNSPVGVCYGDKPDQRQHWLKTRSLAELLDSGTMKRLAACHKSSTDGSFKQSWRFPMASPALTRPIHGHNLYCHVN